MLLEVGYKLTAVLYSVRTTKEKQKQNSERDLQEVRNDLLNYSLHLLLYSDFRRLTTTSL